MWILHLKRLILENHPAKIPAKVRAARLLTAPSLFTEGVNTDLEWDVLEMSLPLAHFLSPSSPSFFPSVFFPLLILLSCALISSSTYFNSTTITFLSLRLTLAMCKWKLRISLSRGEGH